VKRLRFVHRSCVAPHIVFVSGRIGGPTLVFSMDIGWSNAQMLSDFVEIRDVSEDTEGGAVGEPKPFLFLIAGEGLWHVKTFVVACCVHVRLASPYITLLCILKLSPDKSANRKLACNPANTPATPSGHPSENGQLPVAA
jgi:hypothetical protein